MDRNDKVFTLYILYKIVMNKKVSHPAPDEIQNIIYIINNKIYIWYIIT